MNKVTQYYYKSALALGLNVNESTMVPGFELNIGKHHYFICNGFIPINDCVSTHLAHDKFTLNRILSRAKLPVPESKIYTQNDYLKGNIPFKQLSYPVVVKPALGTAFGEGVVCNIQEEHTLKEILDKSFQQYPKLTIEHFESNLISYRVLVLCGQVIGLVERTPALVVGNGKDTTKALIDSKNIHRVKVGLPKIILNEETDILFAEQNHHMNSIPKVDEVVWLRYVCNYSQGGTFASILVKQMHPDNHQLMKEAAKTINLAYVGFDVLCEDIRKPIQETRGYFIEANPNPGIFFHEEPFEGEPVEVSKLVLLKLLAQHPMHYLTFKYQKKGKRAIILLTILIACLML